MESIDNAYNVKRFGLILAVQAEIEGMKAENQDREARNESPAFVQIYFDEKAEELRNLAYKHDEEL